MWRDDSRPWSHYGGGSGYIAGLSFKLAQLRRQTSLTCPSIAALISVVIIVAVTVVETVNIMFNAITTTVRAPSRATSIVAGTEAFAFPNTGPATKYVGRVSLER